MDRKRMGLKLDAYSKHELLEKMKSHIKPEHMPKQLHELLQKMSGGAEAVSEDMMEDADT